MDHASSCAHRPSRLAVLGLAVGVVASASCRHESSVAQCAQCAVTTGYRVAFQDPVPASNTLVLFDGWANLWCRSDVGCVGAPDVTLGDVRWGKCDQTELIAFAPGYGPAVVPDCERQTDSPERCTGEASISLPDQFPVQVAVWVAASAGEMAAAKHEAELEMEHANIALTAAAAGITFEYVVTGLSDAQAEVVGSACSAAGRIKQPDSGVFTSGALNLYFLPTLSGDVGFDCWHPDGVNRDIAFVSRDAMRPALLVHELGHALGLMMSPGPDGHVDDLTEFPDYVELPDFRGNMMNSGVVAFESVWLGQIYRIHFDKKLRWLNRYVPTAFGRECQVGAHDDVPCPPLALRFQGWP